jgi:hypothetical protein
VCVEKHDRGASPFGLYPVTADDHERAVTWSVHVHLVAFLEVPPIDDSDETRAFQFVEMIRDLLDRRVDGLRELRRRLGEL